MHMDGRLKTLYCPFTIYREFADPLTMDMRPLHVLYFYKNGTRQQTLDARFS